MANGYSPIFSCEERRANVTILPQKCQSFFQTSQALSPKSWGKIGVGPNQLIYIECDNCNSNYTVDFIANASYIYLTK